MKAIEELMDVLQKHYEVIERISDDLLKAFRLYRGVPYQTFYYDLSGTISLENLRLYLKKNITDDYFGSPGAMQWNYYVVFLVNRDIDPQEKVSIESDLDFARKFILKHDDLPSWLNRLYNVYNTSFSETIDTGLAEIWEAKLREHGLDFLAERTLAFDLGVERIVSGNCPKPSYTYSKSYDVDDQEVAIGQIEWLRPLRYREYPKSDKPFYFRKVNLINGANGHGKTSLLEAIEYFLTGDNIRNYGTNTKKDYNVEVKLLGEQNPRESKNDLGVFAERNRVWYNSTNFHIGSSLASNFNRFNFYNTDASFRLTLNKNDQDIESAFRDLALGEEINQLKVHLETYCERLRYQLESSKQLLNEYQNEIDGASDMINQLSRSKNDFTELFESLNYKLSEVNVVFPFYNVEIPDLEDIRRCLKDFNTNLVGFLRDVNWLPEVTFRAIKLEHQQLSAVDSIIKKINTDIQDDIESKTNVESKKNLGLKKIDLLRAYLRHMNNGMIESEPEFKIYLDLTDEKKSLFEDYPDMKKHYESRYAHFEITIPEYINQLLRRQSDLIIEQRNARTATKTGRDSLAQLEKVASSILDYGNQYLDLGFDACICPLCKNTFKSHEKFKNDIGLHLDLSNQREIFSGIVREEKAIDSELFDLSYDFDRIHSLQNKVVNGRYKENFNLQIHTIAEIIRMIYKLVADELNQSEASIIRINEIIQWGERRKSNLIEFGFIKRQLSSYFDAKVLKSVAKIESIILELEGFVRVCNEQLSQHAIEIDNLRNERRDLLNNFIPITVEMSEQQVENLLFERTEKLNRYAENLINNRFLTYDDNKSPAQILHDTEALYEFVDQMCYDLTLNQKSTSLSKQAMDTIEERTALVKQMGLEINRIEFALKTVETLNKQHSEDDYLNEFLLANKERIRNIFLTIHAPKEFKDVLIIDGKVQLEKVNGEIIDLYAISTGQRSALALSVFLALNNKVKKGPRLMIFDDPLAFTDDLNILSFLDHLREIILSKNNDTQLFFATANDNLAFLFKKKFEMFDGTYQNIILKR